jgi:predicted site-specific integrase-resolvase
MYMKLSVWAKQNGIHYLTAYRWFKAGALPVPAVQTNTGTILVQEKSTLLAAGPTVVYARVSSGNKRDDLIRQADRCVAFGHAKGWEISKVYREVASGMNDHRPKLLNMLKNHPGRIVVEHKDRLTRFGFHYFETLLPMLDCELVVMNRDAEEKDDLLKDLIAIITSFCCRLYGLRRGRVRAKECSEQLK